MLPCSSGNLHYVVEWYELPIRSSRVPADCHKIAKAILHYGAAADSTALDGEPKYWPPSSLVRAFRLGRKNTFE